jgi:heme/copper-type cytochrome/quinol oxidase subunit 2
MFCKGKVSQRDKTHSPQLTINKTLTIIIITIQVNVVIKAAFSSSRWQEAIQARHKKPSKDLLTGLRLLILKTYKPVIRGLSCRILY